MSTPSSVDIDKWNVWRKAPTPENLSHLLKQMEPVIYTATKANQGTLSPTVVEAEAKIQAVNAFKSYDPKHETKLSTHVTNYLQKVNRLNYKYQEIFEVPEQRRIKYTTFQTTKSNLSDKLQREPNSEELAQELGWSRAEVGRFNAEARKEYSDTQSYDSDLAIHDTKDATLLSYVYNDLTPKNKLLFEHTTGYNNKKILSNPALCKKLSMTQGQLSYAKKQLTEQITKSVGGSSGV